MISFILDNSSNHFGDGNLYFELEMYDENVPEIEVYLPYKDYSEEQFRQIYDYAKEKAKNKAYFGKHEDLDEDEE